MSQGFKDLKNKKAKDLKKEQSERQTKVNAFIEEYTELCKERGLQVDPFLVNGKRGIYATPVVIVHYNGSIIKNKWLFMINHLFKRMTTNTPFHKNRFVKAYGIVCKKHKLQLNPIIEITESGITPKISISNFNPAPPEGFEVKDWDEAKKENEKKQMFEIGMNLKTKKVKPKLFIISLRGFSGEKSAVTNIVSVSFTLDEAIDGAKMTADKLVPAAEVNRPVWELDNYISYSPEKLIAMFNDFKDPRNKNTTN